MQNSTPEFNPLSSSQHHSAGPSDLLDIASETDSIFSRDDERNVILEGTSTPPPQYQRHDPAAVIDLTGDTPPPPPVASRAQSVSSSVVDLTGPSSPISVPRSLVGTVIDLTEE